jgi:hypothetical protein
VSSAVAAASRRTSAQASLHALEQTIAASNSRDPVRRLEILRRAASADGSYVAAAHLSEQIEAARSLRRTGRARWKAVAMTTAEFLERQLLDLLDAANTTTGAARVAAIRAATETRKALDIERDGDVGEELDDDALIAKFEEEAVDMPDEHLAVFVRAYCERHALDFPRRVHAGHGGAS